MTLFRNTAEGGTATAGVTLGNSGATSGDALRTNITGSGSTLTYTSTSGQFSEGAMGFRHVWVAGGQSCLRAPTGLSSTNFGISFDFKFLALPASGSHELVDIWNSASTQSTDHVMKLYVNADGTIRARDLGATANTTALTGLGMTPLVNGTWYRIDIVIIPNASPTGGTIKWRICLQGSNTPLSGANISSSAVNAGSNPITDWYIGAPENHTLAGEMYTDDIRWEDATAGAFLGAYAAPSNTPPTVAALTKVKITQGNTVSATMITTDTDGTVNAWEWLPDTWPEAAPTPVLTGANTATFTSNALSVPGIYTFKYRARDNLLAWSAQSTFRVGVAAADNGADPRGVRSNPGGYSGVIDDLTDTSTTTGFVSPSAPSNSVITYDMDPIADTDISFDYVSADLDPDGTGVSCSMKIEVINGTGTTVIATRTFTVVDAVTNFPFQFTGPENTAFTDRIDWAVRETTNQI